MLIDRFGRHIKGLRLSVTTRCNLRCFYCHREGLDDSVELSADYYRVLFKVASKLGIEKLKITGGEPLLRSDLERIISYGKEFFKEVALTTNGTMLSERVSSLKNSGLDRINISLDTLDREKFVKITGRDVFNKVLESIYKSIEIGLRPVKVNVVIIDGLNDGEIKNFIAFSRDSRAVVQFIQPQKTNYSYDFSALESFLDKNSEKVSYNELHRRKQYYLGGEYRGAVVELVRPQHNSEFCLNCKRIRVSPDGKLKPCIYSREYVDVFEALRNSDEDEVLRAFMRIVEIRKPYWVDENVSR